MPAYFGLDIGSSSIKILKLKGNKNVEAVGMAVNPVGRSDLDLPVEQKTKLVEAVKALIKESGVKSRNVVLSIPESLVFSRILKLPIMSTPELASAIKWELDQVVPFPPDEIEISWVVIDKPKKKIGNEKMKVFVVAVPKKVSEVYVKFLTLTGLEPERIENEILSLARGLSGFTADKGVSLILDVGASFTKMVVVEKEQIYLSHVVPLAGMAMTRMIAETFKIPVNQAEEYKRVYGVDKSQVEGKIYNTLVGLMDSLAVEIKKVMANFSNTEKDKRIERIVLVGGGAFLKGFTGVLVEKTGLDVVMGDPFGTIEVAEKIKASGVVFATALGLAIGE
ncbi:type IV pilus assembly protein PilM [Patescibacteria group bacterium]|nr:type IV pilus assembly protein PilM [Patescibacteria group bacterium]